MKMTNEMCDAMFQEQDITTKHYLTLIMMELKQAKAKHPKWPKDFVHAAAIVAEESGELTRASLLYNYEKGRYFDMHKEAIQTGAMALRFLVDSQWKTGDIERKYQQSNNEIDD